MLKIDLMLTVCRCNKTESENVFITPILLNRNIHQARVYMTFTPAGNRKACKISKGGNMIHSRNKAIERHQHGAGDKAMAEESREELLTVHEVARRLRVDDTTVRRWIKSGAMEAIALPHKGKRQAYRVKKTTLDALLGGPLPLA
jgi:excisionase family DNA binding protein